MLLLGCRSRSLGGLIERVRHGGYGNGNTGRKLYRALLLFRYSRGGYRRVQGGVFTRDGLKYYLTDLLTLGGGRLGLAVHGGADVGGLTASVHVAVVFDACHSLLPVGGASEDEVEAVVDGVRGVVDEFKLVLTLDVEGLDGVLDLGVEGGFRGDTSQADGYSSFRSLLSDRGVEETARA